MLSASAYSFRQQSRLAISLSWIAGYTNVIALLAMGTVVSHVTGNVTLFGRQLGEGEFRPALFIGYLLATFMLGAALSAFLTESAMRRGWRSKYVLPVAVEAILLLLLCLHLHYRNAGSAGFYYQGAGLATIAMGLQNATITRISGAVVRTTHLTGIFTDLGLEGVRYFFWVGDKFSKKRPQRAARNLQGPQGHPTFLRLALLLSIAGSFGFGVVAGTIAYRYAASLSLLALALFLMWIVAVDFTKPIADIRELDLLNDPELRLQGMLTKLLPPQVALYRATSANGPTDHRAPDFQLWLDRVSEDCRVVVLAVSPRTRFDANAVMDLEAAIARLQEGNRKLILSGITSLQFKSLDELGVERTMDVQNICPDLEFAIARAMVLLEQQAMPSGSANIS